MPEWQVEHGIGESRALLVDGEEILAAKLRWPGDLPVGTPVSAALYSKPAGRSRGLARMANGTELMVDRIPAHCNEGAAVPLVVTRAAIAERGRFKRAQARVVEDTDNSPSQQATDHVFLLVRPRVNIFMDGENAGTDMITYPSQPAPPFFFPVIRRGTDLCSRFHEW